MKRLIVNADDFGLSPGVNRGIIRAHREGIVTSATLMVTMPAWAEAVELARATPTLAVGLHVNLTAGRPLAGPAPSLTGPDGGFRRPAELGASAETAEAEREVRAQVERFLATGLPLSHLDSHHHVHQGVPAVGAAVSKVAAELRVPVRGTDARLESRFYGAPGVSLRALLDLLGQLPDGPTDLMTHPGEADELLEKLSSYHAGRRAELALLIAPAVREAIDRLGIELITYADLKR